MILPISVYLNFVLAREYVLYFELFFELQNMIRWRAFKLLIRPHKLEIKKGVDSKTMVVI